MFFEDAFIHATSGFEKSDINAFLLAIFDPGRKILGETFAADAAITLMMDNPILATKPFAGDGGVNNPLVIKFFFLTDFVKVVGEHDLNDAVEVVDVF